MVDIVISVSVSVFLILLIRKGLAKHVSAGAVYALWLVPVMQLSGISQFLYSRLLVVLGIRSYSILFEVCPEIYDVVAKKLNRVVRFGEAFATGQAVAAGAGAAPMSAGISVGELLRFFWLLGAVLVAAALFIPYMRMWLYVRGHRKPCPEDVQGQKVYLVEHLPVSCLLGGKIYISGEQQKEEYLEYVVRHEAMHRRQGDVLWNMVRAVCVAVYWWHPAVWIAAYVSKTDSEYACDEKVMKNMAEEEKISYGKMLLELATKETCVRKNNFFTCAIYGGRIKERIRRIFRKEEKAMLPKAVFAVCVAFLFCLVALFTNGREISLETSNWCEKIRSYAEVPVSETFYAESTSYGDGRLSVMVEGDTEQICEVAEKWLEYKKDGEFCVVLKNNLQQEEMVTCFAGEEFWADREDGKRLVQFSYRDDPTRRLLTDCVSEEFGKNYPALVNGEYRMNYVIHYLDTDRYELLRTTFRVNGR